MDNEERVVRLAKPLKKGLLRLVFSRFFVIVLLLAGIIALTIIAVPAIQYKNAERTLFVQRIQSECDEAIRQTATLSRNAGADSAARRRSPSSPRIPPIPSPRPTAAC